MPANLFQLYTGLPQNMCEMERFPATASFAASTEKILPEILWRAVRHPHPAAQQACARVAISFPPCPIKRVKKKHWFGLNQCFLVECKTNWDICGNPWLSRLCGSSPIIFLPFCCDGCGFSTRGSILVFDQKRCPLYPCRKIDWGKHLLHRTHHPRSSSSR